MIEELLRGNITQKEALIYYEATLTYKILPIGIKGFVFNYKGINNIIINKNLSYYKRRKTLIHELMHLELNHLCQSYGLNRKVYEFEVDNYMEMYKNYLKDISKYDVICEIK